jgi:hypothetical protein
MSCESSYNIIYYNVNNQTYVMRVQLQFNPIQCIKLYYTTAAIIIVVPS